MDRRENEIRENERKKMIKTILQGGPGWGLISSIHQVLVEKQQKHIKKEKRPNT